MLLTVSRGAAALALVIAAAVSAEAADLAVARKKAGECAPCHGLNGIAVQPDAPNLAGDSAYYLTAQLKAFKAGKRQHEQMSIIAKGLSDADIDDLAAWFSAITVEATLPEVK
ncbi:c-type cytochrome [Jiella sonneratiae]|uniref:C-type cytochrome n=1 Tax=Jiella sonneratiae TaxID=2816856 RepID=A0ABS3IYC3_9HYPH|nr:c-type cytochrome [Jiella sonneratiae]MBO0902403.1 c-type cytochrome [Jiella sonneratiae]